MNKYDMSWREINLAERDRVFIIHVDGLIDALVFAFVFFSVTGLLAWLS